jgi:hypothetical protein
MGESLGLAFRVGPEEVVRELVIDHLDPHPLRIIDAAALPVLGMDEVDAAVLEGSAGGFAPIDVFVPPDLRPAQMIIAAEIGDGAAKGNEAMVAKESDQIFVHLAAPVDGWQEHSHFRRPPDENLPIIRSDWQGSQSRV